MRSCTNIDEDHWEQNLVDDPDAVAEDDEFIEDNVSVYDQVVTAF